jgi:hypothetical protein
MLKEEGTAYSIVFSGFSGAVVPWPLLAALTPPVDVRPGFLRDGSGEIHR